MSSREQNIKAVENGVLLASGLHPNIGPSFEWAVNAYDALLASLPEPVRAILEGDERYAVVEVGDKIPDTSEAVGKALYDFDNGETVGFHGDVAANYQERAAVALFVNLDALLLQGFDICRIVPQEQSNETN